MMITTIINGRNSMSFHARNFILTLMFLISSVLSSSSSSSSNYYNDVCQSTLHSRQCNVNSIDETSCSTFHRSLAFQTNKRHSLSSRQLTTKNSNCRRNTLNFINVVISSKRINTINRMSNDKIEDSTTTSTGTVNDDKFGMVQRIDSGKSFVLGAIVGSIAIAPFVGIHDIVFESIITSTSSTINNNGGIAQFEFDCDTSAIIGGLFSVVYRYCIRTDTTNPQLQQGIVGAFAITRLLSRIRIPHYCTSIPLTCGEPLGIIDWNIIQQLTLNGIESFDCYCS